MNVREKLKASLGMSLKRVKEIIKEKQEGFSLIELMIVVAIIGVLVAVAVPNFQRFLARSKQTEAKTNLGSLYGAQKAFHGEWNLYFPDFRAIGYAPEGQLRYHITNGSTAQALPTIYPDSTLKAATLDQFNTTAYCAGAGNCAESAAHIDATESAKVDAEPSGIAFTAAAGSDLDGDAAVDVWTINQEKLIVNTNSDISK